MADNAWSGGMNLEWDTLVLIVTTLTIGALAITDALTHKIYTLIVVVTALVFTTSGIG